MTKIIYEVVKSISHNGRRFQPGEIVTWRNFDGEETSGQSALQHHLDFESLYERDLDAEEIAKIGKMGRWQPLERLGRGGQGTVYRALDTKRVDLDAAAKSLRHGTYMPKVGETPDFRKRSVEFIAAGLRAFRDVENPANLGALRVLHRLEDLDDYTKVIARMKNEIRVYESIHHPNLLRLLDHDVDKAWLTTEYQTGGTLEGSLASFRGDVLRTLEAVTPLIEAVGRLHAMQMVHRDIKPGNIFLGSDGRLILGDAGLAFFLDHAHTRLSETMENVGSWDWMPLYAQGQRWDEVSSSFDVFSLGKLMWAMVAGRPKIQDQKYGLNAGLELEKLFPDHEPARLLGGLLRRLVVATEADHEIKDAAGLHEAVLSLINELRTRVCQACLRGGYVDQADTGNGPLGNMGRRVCGLCHHIQFFQRS